MAYDIELAAKLVARQLRERQASFIQASARADGNYRSLLLKFAEQDGEMADLLESAQGHDDRRKERNA